MFAQLRLDDLTQSPDSLTVNDASMLNAFFDACVQILCYQLLYLAWLESMQVQGSCNGDLDGVVGIALIHSGN